jgi:hypothetical protein
MDFLYFINKSVLIFVHLWLTAFYWIREETGTPGFSVIYSLYGALP